MMTSLLDIKGLHVQYSTRKNIIRAVNGIDLKIDAGKTVGLVGETGAGKTTTALSIMRLISSPPGRISEGEILFQGKDLLKATEHDMRLIRSSEISMIFQDPMTALNPIMRIGQQIAEVIYQHGDCTKTEAMERSKEMLETVGIPAARGSEFPHQFSGGMKQRVVIAMALACNPKLLIADEPTTALDVTIQAQVLEMMSDLKEKFDTSMLLITHDLGIVAEICDEVVIMYAGEIVENGSLEHIFRDARHPYTKGLFASIPSLSKDVDRLTPIPGLMPDPANLPTGCKFHTRCPHATEDCANLKPSLVSVEPGHNVRCLRVERGEL
ncbi:MAG TPA: ABC transporter ATP-binding protein [Papillibacter sp.]|jgi:peptide/nickel transport system ATP-binding protein|nr:ABC transporter ATP-binding protein [Papillibacter sp.]